MKRSILSQWVFGLAGMVVMLWGLSHCYPIISTGTLVTSGPSVAYYFTRLTYLPLPSLVLFALLYEGLGYISIGVFFLGLSTSRAGMAYGSLHIALWFGSIALWYHATFLSGMGVYDNLWPFHTSPMTLLPWLGGALLCSFVLASLRGHIKRFFQQMFVALGSGGMQA